MSATNKPDLLFRHTTIDRAALKKDASGKRTLQVAFSSETPVLRKEGTGLYWEVLSHDPGDADISLLQDGGAFLDEHDFERQVGSVKQAWIDTTDRKGRAVLSFAATDLGNERWQLMSSGHRKDISTGYIQSKLLSETTGADGIPVRRFAAKYYEITTTAVGADHFGTGVNRAVRPQITIMENTYPTSEIVALADEYIKDFGHCRSQLVKLKMQALEKETPKLEFLTACRKVVEANPAPRETRSALDLEIGMGPNDIRRYSIQRALKSILQNNGKLDGFEKDVSEQVEKNSGQRAQGFFVPSDVLLGGSRRSYLQRDMLATDFATGGAVVGIDMLPPIELLRNKSVTDRIGCTLLNGCTGNVILPRQESANIPVALGEGQVIPDTVLGLGQIKMEPNRVGVTTSFSRQLVFQSSPDVEGLIRNDVLEMTALVHDELALTGQGGNQPLGLMNQPGIGSVYFGGTATYQAAVSFETAIAKYNVASTRLAYVSTPATRGRWKGVAVALAGASTVSAKALWEPGNFNDGSDDGLVNGTRAVASMQIPGDRVFYGNWADLIIARWYGLDVVYDVYSKAKQAEIVLTVNSWLDVACRHAQSFVISADSGAQ